MGHSDRQTGSSSERVTETDTDGQSDRWTKQQNGIQASWAVGGLQRPAA